MAYSYDPRTLNHGNAGGFFSTITANISTGATTFGAPVTLTGLVSNDFTTEQTATPFYADNQSHVVLNGVSSTTGTITVYQLNQSFVENHLGKTVTTTNGTTNKSLTDTGVYNPFFYGFYETVSAASGTETKEWTFWTNVRASAPTGTSTTDSDSVTPKEIGIPVTCTPNVAVVDSTGNAVTQITCRDIDGSLQSYVDSMFGTSPSGNIQGLLDYLLGAEEPEPQAAVVGTSVVGGNDVVA